MSNRFQHLVRDALLAAFLAGSVGFAGGRTHPSVCRVEMESAGEGRVWTSGQAWEVKPVAGASGEAVLHGTAADALGESNGIALRIPRSGAYRLWVRYYQSVRPGSFYLLVRDEDGEAVAFRKLDWHARLASERPYLAAPSRPEKPGWAWECVPAVFERPMTASLSVGALIHGDGHARRQVDCVVLSGDPDFDPRAVMLDDLPTPPETRATDVRAAVAPSVHARLFAGVDDLKDRFHLGLINNASMYIDYARIVRLGFNADHGAWRGSARYGVGTMAALGAAEPKRIAVFATGSGRRDCELVIETHCLPAHARFDIPYVDAGTWLEPSEFRQYAGVVIGNLKSKPARAWTDDEIAVVRQYVEDGGHLIFIAGSAMRLAGHGRDVSRLQALLGGAYVGRAAAGSKVVDTDHAITRSLTNDTYPWLGKGACLMQLTTAVPLVGRAGADALAEVAINRVGQGTVVYFGQEWFRLYGGSREDADAYGSMIGAVVSLAGTAAPSRREPWTAEPLGPAVPLPESVAAPTKRKLTTNLRHVTPSDGKPLTLIENGHAVCVLVTGANASRAAEKATEELSRALFRLTGEVPPSVREEDLLLADGATQVRVRGRAEPALSAIIVGDSKVGRRLGLDPTVLPLEGYRLVTRGALLFIIGRDSTPEGLVLHGTMHGAMAFLERHVGFRWLWPGDLGEVVPSLASLVVGPFDETDWPALRQRKLRCSGAAGVPYHQPDVFAVEGDGVLTSKDGRKPKLQVHDRLLSGLRRLGISPDTHIVNIRRAYPWFMRQRLGSSLRLHYTHAYGGWWKKHGEAHPEWFALQMNGRRTQEPARERLCVSNAQLAAEVARAKMLQFEGDPLLTAASISPNDGSSQNNFCMCENCRRLDPPAAQEVQLMFTRGKTRFYVDYPALTDRYVTFYSRVAECLGDSLPSDRWLGCYAYSVYRSPPLYAQVHPRLLVGFVGLGYFNDHRLRLDRERWDAWAAKAQNLFLRPNLLHSGQGLPAAFPRKLSRDIKHCFETGMIAADFDSVMHHWATHGLNYYVLAKLLWDPSADPDAVAQDYCEKGFGPAADHIQRYFDSIQSLTDEIAAGYGQQQERELRGEEAGAGQKLELWQFYTDERLAGLREILERARAAAAGNAVVLERVDFLAFGLRYAELQYQVHQLMDGELDDAGLEEGRWLMDQRYAFFREILARHPLALNVGWLTWREGRGLARTFRWRPPASQ